MGIWDWVNTCIYHRMYFTYVNGRNICISFYPKITMDFIQQKQNKQKISLFCHGHVMYRWLSTHYHNGQHIHPFQSLHNEHFNSKMSYEMLIRPLCYCTLQSEAHIVQHDGHEFIPRILHTIYRFEISCLTSIY